MCVSVFLLSAASCACWCSPEEWKKVLAPRCRITILIIQLFGSTNSFFCSPVFCCALDCAGESFRLAGIDLEEHGTIICMQPEAFWVLMAINYTPGKKMECICRLTHSVESNLGFSLIKKVSRKLACCFHKSRLLAAWLTATHVVMMRCANYPPANDYQFCISRTFSQRLRLSGCVIRANRRRVFSLSRHIDWLKHAVNWFMRRETSALFWNSRNAITQVLSI